MGEEQLKLNLNEIWRIIRKIQDGIFRYELNLWETFKELDPKNTGHVAESKFNNGLGRLKYIIGLSENEIKEVTDYFKQRDGRVAYDQFLAVVCEEGQDHSKNENYVSGLEWNDPLHVNILSQREERRLCILLTKIAQGVRLRELVLKPYFQDYELVARNVGTVTVAHFSRVLHFMKIFLSEEDFFLLLKRYMKNSYTVNYVAFLKNIEDIVKYFDANRIVDNSQDFIENYPGRLIEVSLPKLPRPEIGVVDLEETLGTQTSFHPAFKKNKTLSVIDRIILRIQRHIYENRIRLNEFFRGFDLLNCGKITSNQFVRALDSVGISGLHRLHLSQREIDIVIEVYTDSIDCNLVNWKTFERDIDRGLEKKPFTIVETPIREVAELAKEGQLNWEHEVLIVQKDLCEEALFKIKKRMENRRIYLHQFFRDFDKLNRGYVSRSQARQVLYANGILVSVEEFLALEKRYNNDLGFNYVLFLEDADPILYALPKFKQKFELKSALGPEDIPQKTPCLKSRKPTPQDVINTIANVKKQAVIKQVRIVDFLKDYDPNRENFIREDNFRRGLDNANIKLNAEQMDIICELFAAPMRSKCISYKRFCDTIEEVFMQSGLEKAPLMIPLQYFPFTECIDCTLNFDERTVVSLALQKLSKYPEMVSNLSEVYNDFDKPNCGTITRNQFLRGLAVRDLHNAISSREFDVICKCFGVERGGQFEVDYRGFLRVLDILYFNKEKYTL